MDPYRRIPAGSWVSTNVPARLDRLPWSPWHWRFVLSLGVTWTLDGLEVTIILVTLAIYLIGTLATAFSWNFMSFIFFRAITGAGIGGEGSAMSSAIDEFLPARIRGRVGIFKTAPA